MAIETVSSESGEIVSLDQFRRELGIWDPADDQRAELMLSAARDFCERWSEATLRLTATRTYATDEWPASGWMLRHPPVTAVTSIVYRDANNAEQTFASSNYYTNITAEGYCWIEYVSGVSLPTLYDRPDAVKVTYTTGYASEAVAPEAAKHAIIQMGKVLANTDNPRQAERDEECAMRLLSTVSATNYA